MAVILNIETAADICSLSISVNGTAVAEKHSNELHSHASCTAVFAEELKQYATDKGLEFDAVAVSAGPGSYTGLRIGCSFAKGFCYGSGLPLIAIPTLKIMAQGFMQTAGNTDGLLCPMLDARRMEVYAAVYDSGLNVIQAPAPEIIDEESFARLLDNNKIYFFGNGSDKCRDTIKSPNAVFKGDLPPLATYMARLSEDCFNKRDFADLAYFEPAYLKEFMISTPKHKVI